MSDLKEKANELKDDARDLIDKEVDEPFIEMVKRLSQKDHHRCADRNRRHLRVLYRG